MFPRGQKLRSWDAGERRGVFKRRCRKKQKRPKGAFGEGSKKVCAQIPAGGSFRAAALVMLHHIQHLTYDLIGQEKAPGRQMPAAI